MAITKADFARRLSEKLGFSNREAKRFVEAFLGEITEVLQEGKCVKLSSFGNFMLRDKRARPGRNPRTGEFVTISARRVVVFRPGPKLKSRMTFYDKGDGEQSISNDT